MYKFCRNWQICTFFISTRRSIKHACYYRFGQGYHHHSRQLFKKIKEENEKLEKYAAAPVKAIDRIKKSFEIAMADTDNRLMTQSNAKTKRVAPKVVVESVESKAAEQPAAAEVKK